MRLSISLSPPLALFSPSLCSLSLSALPPPPPPPPPQSCSQSIAFVLVLLSICFALPDMALTSLVSAGTVRGALPCKTHPIPCMHGAYPARVLPGPRATTGHLRVTDGYNLGHHRLPDNKFNSCKDLDTGRSPGALAEGIAHFLQASSTCRPSTPAHPHCRPSRP